ncbi:hypothetical protein HK099_000928 [Clydaea vesicula]|uniref:Polyadenylate-binding protein n=1 Tax=Clydaea vesicula TaxID=447962 RepID=A0AAD5TW45_9FUNG|nr:hypothetical protein HK099_000928 [Clydaea vesicula]KAJ3379785.1 hypothetical protein HDU92_006451 [Lobulomyces angularis]
MATTSTSSVNPTLAPVQPTEVQPIQPGFQPLATQSPTASLYVGELDPSITEAMLFETFNQIGPVASIRVCRDAVTRRSLGYAYVNFHNHSDGERALEALNYVPMKGRPIRVMWSQRDPSARRVGAAVGNIFIKNLDPQIDSKSLHDTFIAFGNILSCKVAMDENGSKGYGFVHYETQDSAQQAIDNVNGMLLNDRKVFVGLHVPKKERTSKIEEMKAQFTNIYVKNLDEEVDDEGFRKIFEEFGVVTSAVLTVDESGKSKGFGFVNFEDHEAAAKAVESMDGKELNGKILYVGRAQKKNEREDELKKQYEKIREEKMNKYQGVNLYVKNLDDSVDDEKLRQEFSAFGVITSAKVMRDEKNDISKGFGFVCFSSPEEATKAVTEMNGRMIANKPIYVALAQRKELRRQQLAVQMQQRSIRLPQAPIPGVGFPGAPAMFYPGQGIPQQSQRGFFGQQPMVQQRRWTGQPIPGQPVVYQQQTGQIPPQFGRGQPSRPVVSQQRPLQAGVMPTAGQIPPASTRGRGGYKYTATARNAPQPAGLVGAVAQATSKPALTMSSLASMPADQQKRTLGEALFPLISSFAGSDMAGKVTGMLLEMDNGELLHLLESPDTLHAKVEEATKVLEEHMKEAENAE